MRPPCGCCSFISRIASWAQRNAPVRLTLTTVCHCSKVRSSMGTSGAFTPALLKSRSSRPNVSLILTNNLRTLSGRPTSAGTQRTVPPAAPVIAAVCSSAATRRPANTTEYPAACRARLTARPTPLPAPVTRLTFLIVSMFLYTAGLQPGCRTESAPVERLPRLFLEAQRATRNAFRLPAGL